MATKLVNWTSKDGQIIKSGLSEGRRAKFLPSVVWFAYDCHGIESYLGNVGQSALIPVPSTYCYCRSIRSPGRRRPATMRFQKGHTRKPPTHLSIAPSSAHRAVETGDIKP